MTSSIYEQAAVHDDKPVTEIGKIINIVTIVLSFISIICAIYLLIITSSKYATTITIKLIRMIAIYTIIEQILFSAISLHLVSEPIWLFIASNVTFTSVNSLAVFWSFSISFLSYKTITTGGSYNKHRFYIKYQVISALVLAYYIVIIAFISSNENNVPQYRNLIVYSFAPSQVLLPICSIILYVMQAIYARRFSSALSQYNIRLRKLILYPIFEAIIFSPSILTAMSQILNITTERADFIVFYELIMQSLPGVLQLLLFLYVRKIATQENLDEKKADQNRSMEIQNISKEINVDRDLAVALRD